MTVTILVGDALEQLRKLPSGSVHTCATSPPYWGLRDYDVPPRAWGGDEACEHHWGDELLDRSRRSPGTQGSTLTGDGRYQATASRFETRSHFCVDCGAWRGVLGLEPTPEMYVDHVVEIFEEVRRVLRKDGTLWLNIGDSYATGAGRVGQAPGGGEQGAKWAGSPRGRAKPGATSMAGEGKRRANRDGSHAGKHTGMTSMGPMTQPNRMPIAGLKPKDLVGIPWMVAFALRRAGWWLRQDVIWNKKNPMPESTQDRCTKAHEYLFLLSRAEHYFYDAAAIAEPAAYAPGCGWEEEAKGTRGGKRGAAQERPIDPEQSFRAIRETRNKRSVWTVSTKPYAEAHFATFPPDLIEPCVRAGTSQRGCCVTCAAGWERVEDFDGRTIGWWPSCRCELPALPRYPKKPRAEELLAAWELDCRDVDKARAAACVPEERRPTRRAVVLDPFGGAGTTGLVAAREQQDAVLIELNPAYAAMARGRIDGESLPLLAAAE